MITELFMSESMIMLSITSSIRKLIFISFIALFSFTVESVDYRRFTGVLPAF